MARPKGSKNIKKVIKVVVEKEPVQKPVEIYIPKPDMGDIKPPPKEEVICHCGHKKATHYGGKNDWCNATGCNCQGIKYGI